MGIKFTLRHTELGLEAFFFGGLPSTVEKILIILKRAGGRLVSPCSPRATLHVFFKLLGIPLVIPGLRKSVF